MSEVCVCFYSKLVNFEDETVIVYPRNYFPCNNGRYFTLSPDAGNLTLRAVRPGLMSVRGCKVGRVPPVAGALALHNSQAQLHFHGSRGE